MEQERRAREQAQVSHTHNSFEDLMHIARNMTEIQSIFQKKRLADAAEAKRQAEEGLQRRVQDEQISRQALEAGDTVLFHVLNMCAHR